MAFLYNFRKLEKGFEKNFGTLIDKITVHGIEIEDIQERLDKIKQDAMEFVKRIPDVVDAKVNEIKVNEKSQIVETEEFIKQFEEQIKEGN